MLTLPASASLIVLDSNVAVWSVVPEMAKIDPSPRLTSWELNDVGLVVPSHWLVECVSSIRLAVYSRVISLDQGRQALADLFLLRVRPSPTDKGLCEAAFEWAERLGQARAYDGFYLALAEAMDAEFWTADERLVSRVQQLGVTWAHWIGEPI
jgi:predicted nucleic acid-binding protein